MCERKLLKYMNASVSSKCNDSKFGVKKNIAINDGNDRL